MSEIYGMVGRVDIVIAIEIILKMITNQLKFFVISTIMYTNSYFFYKCLVKLNTIKEKHFIIDIIAF